MNDMLSAVVSAVSVTQMLRAPFETGLPFASFRQPTGRGEGVFPHDRGERERLASGLDRLAGPLRSVFGHGRVARRAEDDALLLQVIAGEGDPPDPERDDDDPEDDQHPSGDVPADLEQLSVPHRVLPFLAPLDFRPAGGRGCRLRF